MLRNKPPPREGREGRMEPNLLGRYNRYMRLAILAGLLLSVSLLFSQQTNDPSMKHALHPGPTSPRSVQKSRVSVPAAQTKGNSTSQELANIEQQSVKTQTHAASQRTSSPGVRRLDQPKENKNKPINAPYRPPGQGSKNPVK